MITKTTQRAIRNIIANGSAIDVTGWSTEDLGALKLNADVVAVATGVYGLNGIIVKHRETCELYAAPSRSSAAIALR